MQKKKFDLFVNFYFLVFISLEKFSFKFLSELDWKQIKNTRLFFIAIIPNPRIHFLNKSSISLIYKMVLTFIFEHARIFFILIVAFHKLLIFFNKVLFWDQILIYFTSQVYKVISVTVKQNLLNWYEKFPFIPILKRFV